MLANHKLSSCSDWFLLEVDNWGVPAKATMGKQEGLSSVSNSNCLIMNVYLEKHLYLSTFWPLSSETRVPQRFPLQSCLVWPCWISTNLLCGITSNNFILTLNNGILQQKQMCSLSPITGKESVYWFLNRKFQTFKIPEFQVCRWWIWQVFFC